MLVSDISLGEFFSMWYGLVAKVDAVRRAVPKTNTEERNTFRHSLGLSENASADGQQSASNN